MRRGLVGAAFISLLLPFSLQAQGDCFPSEDSNEAKVFGIFGVPFAFGPGVAPRDLRPWQFRATVEVSSVPSVDDETATPTTCRPGKGPENTDFAPILPRPRIMTGLPGGFILEAGWVPPVPISGATANVISVSLARNFGFGTVRPGTVSLRLHATTGRVEAPITCDEEALQDPVSECFGGTESEDRYKPNSLGAEVAGSVMLAGGRIRPFAGTGINLLKPRFQVNFTNRFGQLDNRKVEVDLERVVVFGGFTWLASPRIGITVQAYSAPADAVVGRVGVAIEN